MTVHQIRVNALRTLTIEPGPGDTVRLGLVVAGLPIGNFDATPDQAAATLFAIEQVLGRRPAMPKATCTGNCNQGRSCTCKVG